MAINKSKDKKEKNIEPKVKKKKAIRLIEYTDKVKEEISKAAIELKNVDMKDIEEIKIVKKYGKQYLVINNEG